MAQLKLDSSRHSNGNSITHARGRNGWFVPTTVRVSHCNMDSPIPEWRGTVEIAVCSSRSAELSPIIVSLTAADVLKLAEELTTAARLALK